MLQIPWSNQCLWKTGRSFIRMRELYQIIWSPIFASVMSATSVKCNSTQVSNTSWTKESLIPNVGMSSLWRLQEKIVLPPSFFQAVLENKFPFPAIIGRVKVELVYINHFQAALLVSDRLYLPRDWNRKTFYSLFVKPLRRWLAALKYRPVGKPVDF